ncbi:MAG: hypothetical protein CVU11_04145 [Bacteroidetes bacterium HGW-Bacteroidetes-6]|jgi:cytosine/adenosine deaminase-related metal-dependent hydrolase|nr:MAG: hypothetical protein CVU11_04145 [Bacteroidetes bacterium HGW-Bacteroidetes-6]
MKKYFPEYFLDESGCIATGKIVVVRNNGIIDDIVEANSDMDDVVSLRGLMLPGLTNSHCHLELSWIQGLLPEGLGIERFYDAMQGVHQQKPENTESIIRHIIDEQFTLGVSIMADISNTATTLNAKENCPIRFHTFVETFSRHSSQADERLIAALDLFEQFGSSNKNTASLSAHTLLTLSEDLMSRLMQKISTNKQLHSIHFLESSQEVDFFEKGRPLKNIHEQVDFQKPLFSSAVHAAIGQLPAEVPVVFIHNTFADKTDIDALVHYFEEPWFCFCPSSNLYITEELPNVPLFIEKTHNLVIGTDSLASNKELNLLKEIDILLDAYPAICPEDLLQAITINGARMLNVENMFGSISACKKPGLILLEDYQPGLRAFSTLNLRRLE